MRHTSKVASRVPPPTLAQAWPSVPAVKASHHGPPVVVVHRMGSKVAASHSAVPGVSTHTRSTSAWVHRTLAERSGSAMSPPAISSISVQRVCVVASARRSGTADWEGGGAAAATAAAWRWRRRRRRGRRNLRKTCTSGGLLTSSGVSHWEEALEKAWRSAPALLSASRMAKPRNWLHAQSGLFRHVHVATICASTGPTYGTLIFLEEDPLVARVERKLEFKVHAVVGRRRRRRRRGRRRRRLGRPGRCSPR